MDQGERPRNAKLLIAKRVVDIWSTALFLFLEKRLHKPKTAPKCGSSALIRKAQSLSGRLR